MSVGADDMAPPAATRTRRGSFGRYLERFRTVLNSRRRSAAAGNTIVPPTEPLAVSREGTIPSPAKQPESLALQNAALQALLAQPTLIDDGLDDRAVDLSPFGPTDEPLVPVVPRKLVVRAERAQLLYEKYGFAYDLSRSMPEKKSAKPHRIEKPVHIRVHWRCHRCEGSFGHNRICLACNHTRCDQCKRSPAKRVKQLMAAAETLKQHDDLLSATVVQAEAAEIARSSGVRLGEMAPIPAIDTRQGDVLEVDEAQGGPVQVQLVMRVRPNRGKALLLQESTLNQNATQNADEQMVKTVQRVHKKPRRRVRYSCENCQTVFSHSNQCMQCGHGRCKDCLRDPLKRERAPHDPAIVDALARRLAGYEFAPAPRPLVTAS